MSRELLVLDAAKRGKYGPLFHRLSSNGLEDWATTFKELEHILGFSLPKSARLYRPWWANDAKSGHSQAMAWQAAGWKTTMVDLEAETLIFTRM